MLRNRAVLVLTFLLLGSSARATEVPQLLADVNRQPGSNDRTAAVASGFVPAGDHRMVFWTTILGDFGLWSTDGTTAGTSWLPLSLCPDFCTVTSAGSLHNVALLNVQSRLWRTDGTLAGTYPLTELLSDLSEPTLVEGPGTAFMAFVGCRPADGCELWRSDGTPGGTTLVKDIHPGPDGIAPHGLTAWHGRLYFFADDGTGMGLWSTDGTAGGTAFLAGVDEDTWPEILGAGTSRLFFTAGEFRQELWATDGTATGTGLVSAFDVRHCPAPDGCPFINSFQASGDGMLFGAYDDALGEDQLWSTDGTATGTLRRLGFPMRRSQTFGPLLDDTLRRVGTRWIVLVTNPDNIGYRLWASDGDLGSATPLAGCEGGCPIASSLLGFEAHTGGLLFAGFDPDHGTELWITDGTGPGTHRLTDVCPGPCAGVIGGRSPGPSSSGGTYFVATPDGDRRELWVTDGSPAGTRRLESLADDAGVRDGLAYFATPEGEVRVTDGTPAGDRQVTVLQRRAPSSNPLFAPVQGGAVMLADEGEQQYLWVSDGTPAGTRRLLATPVNDSFQFGFSQAGRLQFFAVVKTDPEGGDSQELWRTDGTEKGTFRVRAFSSGRLLSAGVDWNGKLLFQVYELASDRCSGWWISDGTPAGTREILQVPRDVQCAEGVQAFGSQFLFFARVGTGRVVVPQIFVSDGTPAGTRQVSRIEGYRYPVYPSLTRVGGTAVFLIADLRGRNVEVWRSDGTPQGASYVTKVPVPDLFSVLVPFRGAVYFLAPTSRDVSSPIALWRVSLHGPPVVLHVTGNAHPLQLAPLGDRLLFAANGDDGHGVELWQTDGTPDGTALVKDVNPGPGSSSLMDLTTAGNRVFFSARDGLHGWELWESDGTAAGTRLVRDLNPGPFSSSPQNFVVSGSNLFFAADDGVTGNEPWVLPLEPRTP